MRNPRPLESFAGELVLTVRAPAVHVGRPRHSQRSIPDPACLHACMRRDVDCVAKFNYSHGRAH